MTAPMTIPDEAVQAAENELRRIICEWDRRREFLNVSPSPKNDFMRKQAEGLTARILSAIEVAPSPRAQALEEIRAIAEKQKAYWFEKQKCVKALEEAYSEDGEDYTPLGDHEAWKSGSANGHYSEADWFLKTIESLLSHLAPIHADNAHGRALEEEEFAIDKLRVRAFHTNSEADRKAYFDAVSKWFQDRHYRRMDAERALSSQPVADGWLPIETAPKDGTDILVWSTLYRGKPVIVRWEEDKYAKRPIPRWISSDSAYGARSFVDSPPTHWRPLPASPEVSG